MHNAVLVGVRERACDVAQDAHRLADRKRSAVQPITQRRAVDERHRVVRHAVHLSGAEHGHDVRMLQARRESNLTIEPVHAPAGEQVGREHLHHDVAAKRFVARHEHARHAPSTELSLDRVRRTQRILQLLAEGHELTAGVRPTREGR